MNEEEFKTNYKEYLAVCTEIISVPKTKSFKDRVGLKCNVHNREYSIRRDTLKEAGCKFCRREVVKKEYDQKWKEDCTEIHYGLYDYSNTIVGDVLKLSNIFCNACQKPFKQTPASHKSGKGCPTCGVKKRTLILKNNLETTVERAKELGFNYDFSNAVYITCKDEMELICDKGHTFLKTADVLLNAKQGCPYCSSGRQTSKGEKEIFEFVSQFFECISNES